MFVEGETVHINSQEDVTRQETSGSTKSEVNANSNKGAENEANDIDNRKGSSRLGQINYLLAIRLFIVLKKLDELLGYTGERAFRRTSNTKTN